MVLNYRDVLECLSPCFPIDQSALNESLGQVYGPYNNILV